MKARIQKKDPPVALLYNLENGRSIDIAEICGELGIRPIHLDTTFGAYSVGHLCGLEGFDGDIIPCDIPQSEAVILSAVDKMTMNTLLARMKETNNSVDLKCVVTDTNKSWALGRLVAELEKEHATMNG